MGKGENLLLKKEIVKDYFYLQGNKIVVLENNAFKNIDKDILVLGKLVEDNKKSTIVSLTEQEYNEATEKYDALVKLMGNEEGLNG